MMPTVLSHRRPTLQIPKPRHMIRRRSDEVRRICAERSIPYPSLMTRQSPLELVRIVLGRPDLDRRVR